MSLQSFGLKSDTRWKRRRGELISDRDKELLLLMSEGLATKEICEMLFVCQDAIRTRKYQLYQRLGVRNGVQAVAWALRNKIIE